MCFPDNMQLNNFKSYKLYLECKLLKAKLSHELKKKKKYLKNYIRYKITFPTPS